MKIVLFLLLLLKLSSAYVLEVSGVDSLLEHSRLYVGENELTLESLNKKLKPYCKEHINIGVKHQSIWIRFDLKNSTNRNMKRLLVLSSPLLEEITLFSSNLKPLAEEGMLRHSKKHSTIPYVFELNFQAKSQSCYYLRVTSKHTPIDFSLSLKKKETFLIHDIKRQFIDTLLIGMIMAMMLYSLLVSLYLKDKSYFFYALYLFTLIYQQMTYLGLTQIYAPHTFIALEATLTLSKILFLIFTSALFAMHFLETNRLPKINLFYKSIMVILFLEFLFLDSMEEYSLNIVIITGAIFIVGNLFSGFYAYFKGVKEARLFIVGFGVVFFSYIMMIVDALGLASVMVYFPNILMDSTAIEALVLLLAFADRYLILQEEKHRVDRQILQELRDREKLITQEVRRKTEDLNGALEEKNLLLQEVHHRVKNNLQIILSLIRLQADSISSETLREKFSVVENRINAIAKTYSILLSKDSFKTIDMQEYIDELVDDLRFAMGKEELKIQKEIALQLPIKEAIYVGLVINELLTNAFKYAFEQEEGIIYIRLYQQNTQRFLEIEDNGKGYSHEHQKDSLGLRLVKMIVKNQLKGRIEIDSTSHTKTVIRF